MTWRDRNNIWFTHLAEVVCKKIDLLSHLCFIKLFPLENVSIKHPPLKICLFAEVNKRTAMINGALFVTHPGFFFFFTLYLALHLYVIDSQLQYFLWQSPILIFCFVTTFFTEDVPPLQIEAVWGQNRFMSVLLLHNNINNCIFFRRLYVAHPV